MRLAALLLLIFWHSKTCCQSFNAEARLSDVEADGFYRIILSPELNVHLKNDFSDVRIYDQKNREVPFLFKKESPAYFSKRFYEYEIVEKNHKTGCCTSLILRNPNRTPINNISLVIKNAQAAREATLLASDDKQEWFALKDSFVLNAIDDPNGTMEIKIVDFPWSNYEFYLLRLNDSTRAPLNILKAGYYDVNSEIGNYTEIKASKILSSDSSEQKKTYVRILFDTVQFVDKVEIEISGAKYYRRRATLSEKKIRKSKKGVRTEYFNTVQSFELTSGRTAILQLPAIRARELLIAIENDDSPPLTIPEVKLYQLNRYLTAWLNKGDRYVLKLGDRKLNVPVYDLAFFKDSIPAQLPTAEVSNVNVMKVTEAGASRTLFTNKAIIWIAIIVVMLVLGFMSANLIRESGKTEIKD